MCAACGARLSRRDALLLAGGTAAIVLGAPSHAVAQSVPTGYGVTIQPRSTWAGDTRPPAGELRGDEVRFLLVHHTATSNGADPIGTMRGVYDFHTSAEKGWPDVAYNFFIASDGVVYEARTGSLAGAVEASATGGSQGFAQLVCLLGDFSAQNPSEAALTSLNATLAWLADRHGLDTSAGATATFTSRGSNRWPEGTEVTTSIIAGHRDMSQTACPGDTFYPYLVANVRADVHEQRTGVATTSSTPSTPSSPSTPPAPPTAPESSTIATFPESTTAPDAPPTDAPGTTPATVATATVDTPPPPAVDESVAAIPEAADTGLDSSNPTAIAVAAGAAVLTGAGAVYVGLRRRPDDASAPDDESPLPSADA